MDDRRMQLGLREAIELVRHLRWLANADEEDRITQIDLSKCDDAAELIEDLMAERDAMRYALAKAVK
jgi:hypothetical protein